MADINQDLTVRIKAKDLASQQVKFFENQLKKTDGQVGAIERSMGSLQTKILAVFGVSQLRRLAEYGLELGRAADKSSDLYKRTVELDEAMSKLRKSSDTFLKGAVEKAAPIWTDFITGVSGALDDLNRRIGNVETKALEAAEARLARTKAAIESVDANLKRLGSQPITGLDKQALRDAGAQVDTNFFGTPSDREQLLGAMNSLNTQYRVQSTEVGRLKKAVQELNQEQEVSEEIQKRLAGGGGLIPGLDNGSLLRLQDRIDAERAAAAADKAKTNEQFAKTPFVPELPGAGEQQGPPIDEESLRRAKPLVDRLGESWNTLTTRVFNFKDAASDAVLQVGGALENNLAQAFESVIDGTADAEEAFKGFAKGVVKDLISIGSRLLAVFVLESLTGVKLSGARSGGVFGGRGRGEPLRVHNMMSGGIARGTSAVVYGEGSRSEAFVPLDDGKTIPVSIRQRGGGTTNNIYISAVDAPSVQRLFVENGEAILGVQRYGLQHSRVHRESTRKAVR